MTHFTRFFWFCSGANFGLLRRVPTESSKYAGIGATVFFTGILAALAAGYALFTVFENLGMAVLFALIWGMMIFNLDRFIVSSMRKNQKRWLEWKLAIPRIVLAVLLALVISKPLELKIFEREINRTLDEKKSQMIFQSKLELAKGFPEIQELETQIQLLKSEIKEAELVRNQIQKEYDQERFGTKTAGTSGKVGLGTNAKKKEQQLDAAQGFLDDLQEMNQLKINELEAEILRFRNLRELEFQKQQPGIEGFDGLGARMEALDTLTDQSLAFAAASLWITLLFIAIETAPILVKLISSRGPYDELLELHEDEVKLLKQEKWAKSKGGSESRIEIFKETNALTTQLEIERTNAQNRTLHGSIKGKLTV
jgi:hypothetical protein